VRVWALAAACAALCACGYVGDPLPPALDVPATVTDFRAWESGDRIEVEFTIPKLTTEGLPLKSVRLVELGVAESPAAVSGPEAKHYPIPAKGPGPVMFQIPAADWTGKTLTLAVRATGPRGKTSAWSNPSALAVIAPLAQPAAVSAVNDPRGVRLTWNGMGPRYRVFRAVGDGEPALLAETDQSPFVDETTVYGEQYRYLVQAIASANQWSVVSEPAAVTTVDTFPPAVPAGLTAVTAPQSIELNWDRNTEADFRGYNVYRSVDGGPAERIASLIPDPAFSDRQIEPGKKYRYSVSAVDATGNESVQSPPQEAAAP
jgi:hypothetical protein